MSMSCLNFLFCSRKSAADSQKCRACVVCHRLKAEFLLDNEDRGKWLWDFFGPFFPPVNWGVSFPRGFSSLFLET